MKIKSFVVTVVLTTAILCSASFVKAQASDNSVLIAQLQAKIQSLMQQIAKIQSPQNTTAPTTNLNSAWCHTFNTNLKIGDTDITKNDEVMDLTIALQDEGFQILHAGSGLQDVFSKNTASIVIQFQKKYGISQTGTVGPKTRAKLNSLYGCPITSSLEPVTTPTQIQTPNPVNCTPNWQCTGFANSGCLNNQQTQTCIDANHCGTTAGEPALTQNGCTPVVITCSPNWQTGTWSACTNGQQTRTVTDSNNCGVALGEPTATQSCNSLTKTTATLTVNFTVINTDGPFSALVSTNGSVPYPYTVPITLPAGETFTVSPRTISGYTPSSTGTCSLASPGAQAGQNYVCTWEYTPTSPAVTFTSPIGGETWKIGETHNITWTSPNYSNSSQIGLLLCDATTISNGANPCASIPNQQLISNSGTYSFTIPSLSIPDSGNLYKIEIVTYPNGTQGAANSAYSNSFSIVPAQ